MGTTLILAGYAFADFEVPNAISFGGQQRHQIHRFLDGGRLIDVLGQDDADISWEGTFAGQFAVERARAIDLLRAAGGSVVLTWDSFIFEVIITEFSAAYESPWWIPYRVRCTIVSDEAAVLVEGVEDIASLINSDLAATSIYADASPIAALPLTGPGVLPGTASFAANTAAIAAYQTSIQDEITGVGATLAELDLAGATAAAGRLANLAIAQGYIGRMANNLSFAQT